MSVQKVKMPSLIVKKTIVVKTVREQDDAIKPVTSAIVSLEADLNSILTSSQRKLPLQELFSIVENLHNTHRSLLYERLHSILEDVLLNKLDYLVKNSDRLLPLLNETWEEFCTNVTTIKNIFLKCDRSSLNSNKYNTVQFLTTGLFKTIIIVNPNIKDSLTKGLLENIYQQRRGNAIDVDLLKSLLKMLIELQVYDYIFQIEFLKSSGVFYLDEGQILIGSIDVRAYLRHCQARIKEEKNRADLYLNKYTSSAVLELLTENLIREHLQQILDKVFALLNERDVDYEELRMMYDLIRKVIMGLKSLMDCFTEYIMRKGSFLVNKPNNDKTMIQDLLNFKDELDNIVQQGFRANDMFNDIIRNCFVKFINSKQNKPSQLLAKYVDSKLKSKDISENNLENILNKVMVLFRYIQGKDIFEAFYKKDLAKRLLLGKSTSQDAEDSMIGKLKAECGTGFTSKIEGMFKDINISQCMNNAFKQHLITTSKMTSDLSINVLTSSFWPNYTSYKVNLPPELVQYQDLFQKFYAVNHSGRKLVWQPDLGHCIVKADFENGKKELQVSLFQAMVLLHFNDSTKMTFNEIHELTNIDKEELKRTLMSLVCVKNRILLKQTKSKEIEPEEVFTINTKFTDKLFRVKINQIQLRETVEEQQATEKSVLADRQFQIDAAIVRILKNKKRINHNGLISELFDNLDIPVKPYDLKKRIELLIEREYMERDKDDPNNYIYIA